MTLGSANESVDNEISIESMPEGKSLSQYQRRGSQFEDQAACTTSVIFPAANAQL